MIRERIRRAQSGFLILFLFLAGIALDVWLFATAIPQELGGRLILAIVALVALMFLPPGFFIVHPNEAKVLVLFGRYYGSVKEPGFWWVNPFTVKKRISLRVRNFETAKLKVNDAHSNPIEVAAIVVWRLAKAGVEVKEARLSHLAYSPEIAQAMLQRQQASAIIAARYKIVEGAVGMVENALELLAQKQILDLDAERRAAMVSNLLVVLGGERGVQPVVNTGTLYGG